MGKTEDAATGIQAVIRTQAGVNERTDGNAARYTDHRRHVMDEIKGLAPSTPGRLCLLGAGNCNDVDVPALTRLFAEVHLVDLDAAAIGRASKRQPDDVRARLTLHAPIDASGLLADVEAWSKKPATLAQIDAAVSSGVQRVAGALPPSFDVVASCCVFTQIGHGITSILGRAHANLADAHQGAAVAHFRLMAALLAPGGRAVMFTDMVSSETYPLDELTPGRDLKEVAAELARVGNFFKGTNPVALARILRRDPILSRQATDVHPIEPWLWRAVQARTFLVNGFSFRRSEAR